MNNREIAVVVSNDNKDVSIIETIDAIKNAGFKNVFVQWYNKEWNHTQEEQLKYIKEKDFIIQKEELSEVKWFDIDEVIDMIKSKDDSTVFREERLSLFEELKNV